MLLSLRGGEIVEYREVLACLLRDAWLMTLEARLVLHQMIPLKSKNNKIKKKRKEKLNYFFFLLGFTKLPIKDFVGPSIEAKIV